MKVLAVIPALVGGCCVAALLLAGGWLMSGANATGSTGCASDLDGNTVPAQLVPLFQQAAARYQLGPQGPAVLAGLTSVESGFGRNMGPSSAGAIGWTQFMPATWRRYGTDADGDGRADPMNAADAITSTARYLHALGAPADWRRALYGYNHANTYVNAVLSRARALAGGRPVAATCVTPIMADRLGRIVGGGRIVPIPGQPGQSIDRRIVADVLALQRRYHFTVTAGYAPTGHAAHGEHPLGLAVDLVPGPGGSWDDIDALAHWAEPTQDHPRPPFRWVGYDGDPGHGRGNHLHLSWNHAPDPAMRPPAAWVDVLLTTP